MTTERPVSALGKAALNMEMSAYAIPIAPRREIELLEAAQ